jgi:hypothetical protein
MCLVLFAFGFGKPEHSAVKVSVKPGELAKPADPPTKIFTFELQMQPDMVLNHDGPWKLEIKAHDGLGLAKTTFDKAELDDKIPGYAVTATAAKAAGELEYQMTVFVCTKEKTQCFREVHKGKYSWQ